MSTSSSAIPKVRTYAADLNAIRSVQKTATITPTATPVTTTKEDDSEKVIPPFHTFSKSDSTPPVKNNTSTSTSEAQRILTATSSLQASGNLKEGLPAVIITDTKRKRFTLSGAILSSMQNWWTNKKQTAGQKKTPKYTVPVAERRKGVIQKATVKTGRESSADHSAVVSRIKATKQIPHTPLTPPPTVSPTSSIITPAWESEQKVETATSPKILVQNQRVVKRQSHTTESVTPLPETVTRTTSSWESDIQAKVNALSEPTPQKSSPIILTGQEFTKIKQARAEQDTLPTITSEVTPTTSPLRTIKPIIPPLIQPEVRTAPLTKPIEVAAVKPIIPTTPVAVAYTAPKKITPVLPIIPEATTPETVVPEPLSRPKIVPIIPQALVSTPPRTFSTATSLPTIEDVPTETNTTNVTPKRQERTFAPPRETKRSIFTLFTQTNHVVFITAAVLIGVVGIGLGVRAYRNAPAVTTEATTPISQTVFSGSTVYIETNVIENKNQLGERIRTQSNEADSLVEISFVGTQGNALTPEEFLTLFDASVPFDFVSSLNAITFGNYRGTPWILVKISDKNIALGGMLAWENNLGQNLSPIFSPTPAPSYARFTDDIINGTDVRVLKNGEGAEEIVYGFIGYDSLLITSSNSAFLNLAQKIY